MVQLLPVWIKRHVRDAGTKQSRGHDVHGGWDSAVQCWTVKFKCPGLLCSFGYDVCQWSEQDQGNQDLVYGQNWQ